MDRPALNELFDFTTFTWETYARAMKPLPPETLLRPLEDSGWASLQEPLFHIAAGWDGWLAEKAGDTLNESAIEEVTSWPAIQAVRDQTRAWMRRILDEMSDYDLFEKPESPWPERPEATPSPAADVLTHILLHERGHHGDITTLLSQAGASIGNSDFLIYQFFKNRKA